MIALLRSEWHKVTTTKMWWILLLSASAFTLLQTVVPFLLANEIADQTGRPPFADPADVTNAIGSGGAAAVFILILGILGMTTEYRHMTITPTFLASPHRARVLVAKGVLYALIGAAFAVVMFALALGTTAVGLSMLSNEHASIDTSTATQILGGIVLGFAIFAIVGVSLGGLIRNQIAAIVVGLAWMMLIEPLLSVVPFLDNVVQWLPASALNATLQITNTSGFGNTDVLPVGVAALVLLGYAVVFGVVASTTTLRRDIT